MFKTDFLPVTAMACLTATTPVFADAQTTEILEEYFDLFKSTPVTIDVGAKDDGSRFTQWNDIVVRSESNDAVINIPWIKVSRKLLGGVEMTFAEEINGALQGFSENVGEPVKFVIQSKGAIVGIDGDAGARSYASSFDEMTFKTVGSKDIVVDAKVEGGSSNQTIKQGDAETTSGDFSFTTMVLNYAFDVDGQSVTSNSSFDGLSGEFDIPLYKDFDPENPIGFFDPERDAVITYRLGSGITDTVINSDAGPMTTKASYGAGSGKLALLDKVVELSGNLKDMNYDLSAPTLGIPPVKFTMAQTDAKITVPLDNIDKAKPADYKLAFNGLKISEDVWNLFDPQAILPRDDIDLDIDLSADMRWLKKLAEIDVNDKNQAPPFAVDSAKVNALNLRLAGAELKTDGAIVLDNAQFPPVPDGTVNVSLTGAQALLTKLTETGLLPAQNALAIRGMSAVFFDEQGEDHLVSTIKMHKNGRITANDIPIK